MFRLVKEVNQPAFLAFSPFISIENNSVPFRAFLGAILSVASGAVVEASVFVNNQNLAPIDEEQGDGDGDGDGEEESPSSSSSSSDADDGSGEHRGRPGQESAGPDPITCRRARGSSNQAALMVPAPFNLNGPSDIHLDRFPRLPHCPLDHSKSGSIFILSRTTSLIFPHMSTMANVCG